MTSQTLTLDLPAALIRFAEDLAAQRNETIAKVVADMLARDFAGLPGVKPVGNVNPRIISGLRGLLFTEFGSASSWTDLTRRLAHHGYWIKPSWEGLTLHTETSGRRLCLVSDLGFGDGALQRRFGAQVPVVPSETDAVAKISTFCGVYEQQAQLAAET